MDVKFDNNGFISNLSALKDYRRGIRRAVDAPEQDGVEHEENSVCSIM